MNCHERKMSAVCAFTTEKPVMSHSTLNHLCSITILLGLGWSSNGFGETAPKANPVDAHFSVMDTNSDGKLSPDEHAAGARKMFNTMDANNDGRVTAAEMRRTRKGGGKTSHTGGSVLGRKDQSRRYRRRRHSDCR